MVADGGGGGISGLKQCYIELAKADTSGDYDKALKTANKILRNYPKETMAFKCKLIAQIQLGYFEDALLLIKKTPSQHMGECQFEKAYIEYRLNDDKAALETLSKNENTDKDVRCLELKAQLLYRGERFQEAAAIFKKLLKDHSDDYDDERRANLIAVITQIHAMGAPQQAYSQLDTFEQLYNGACHLIEAENYPDALQMLQRAEKMCGETLTDEGLSDEEIEEELSVIRIQKAFVLQKLGHFDEALKIYLRIQQLNPSDQSVLATVINNIASIRREQNLLESRKRLKLALQLPHNKLTNRQRKTLLLNQALMHLYSNQKEGCRRCLEQINERFGCLEESILIEISLNLRFKDIQKAFSIINNTPIVSDQLKLANVQILINEGNLAEACKLLENLPSELANRPAILQLRVALLLATNQRNEALNLLSESIKMATNDHSIQILIEQCASLNIECGNYANGVEYLERLLKLQPKNINILSRLIKLYSNTNTNKAQQLIENISALINDDDNNINNNSKNNINIDELEQSEWILYGERYRQKKDKDKDRDGNIIMKDTEIVTGKLRKRKRKHKVILPKNYDPKVPPDPERWLPRQERTAYKKKLHKRHKDRDIGRGTQGAMAAGHFDGTVPTPTSPKMDANTASPKPTPIMGAGEGPRQQRPAGQQPKKKKKKTANKW